jgi:hypothetical protein
MAHGIVSLLDAASERATRALWAELDARYGLREVTQRVPWPHYSYHVAEDYALAHLEEPLRRVAAQTEPFAATITGLGAFEATEPVLYLAANATLRWTRCTRRSGASWRPSIWRRAHRRSMRRSRGSHTSPWRSAT